MICTSSDNKLHVLMTVFFHLLLDLLVSPHFYLNMHFYYTRVCGMCVPCRLALLVLNSKLNIEEQYKGGGGGGGGGDFIFDE